MPTDRWKKVEALFEQAAGLSPEAQAAFLEDLAARDATLSAEVASLLKADEEAPGFFNGLAGKFVNPVFSMIRMEPEMPACVGRYRLLREIGRGGMSVVYLAARDDGQFEQQVSVKLIRGASKDHIQRFLSERQILASLNHPNVARLFDGGVTEDGRPYFVMEYVEGQHVHRFCDEQHLSIEDRLQLFVRIGEAVQYAHQNLVVHRDLKPSNILVAKDGQVKLLDFGIAKLLGPDEADTSGHTETGERWMTPEYAAPEQIRGERITTATDVYQLGVVLYKLLTGHQPYHLEGKSSYEVERAVCEEMPTRPSTVVLRTAVEGQGSTVKQVTPEAVSSARHTEVTTLRRRLSGDLDAILLKALRKEPSDRYASAEALVEDINRHLSGQPVMARQGSRRYRARKFVQRHQVGVLMSLLFVGLAVAFVLVFTLRVRAERNAARVEAAKAEEVTEFMVGIFSISNPEEARGDTITARELLERGAQQVENELRDQPQVQAQMLQTIGRVYDKLGLYDDSARLLERAAALHRVNPGIDRQDLAESLAHLATSNMNQGKYEEADSLYHEALAIWETVPRDHEEEADALVQMGLLLQKRREFGKADSLYARALTIQQEVLGKEHEAIARTLSQQAAARRDEGRFVEAESLYMEALGMQRGLMGESHPIVAATLNNLAVLMEDQGRYEAADTLYRQALALHRDLLGDTHPDVGKTLNNLAALRRALGDLDEADSLYREALAIKRQNFGAMHPSLGISYFNLAVLLHDKGNYAAAESLYRQTLAIDQKIYGSEHVEIAADLTRLAALLYDKGDLAQANTMFEDALALRRRLPADDRIGLSTTLVGYNRVLRDLGQTERAWSMVREALEIRMQILEKGNWGIAEAQTEVGACLLALQRYAEAEPLLVQGFQTLSARRGTDDPRTRRANSYLIRLYEAWGRPNEAARYQRTASALE